MDLSKLGTLKMKAIAEDDFEPIWDYFFTHFAENEEFLDLGEPHDISGQPAERAILLAAAMVFASNGIDPDESAPFPKVFPVYLPDEKFMHGMVVIQRIPGAFFYFEDLDVGMLCITIDGVKTNFSRISIRPDQGKGLHRA